MLHKPNLGVNGLVIEELNGDDMDVVLTLVQEAKVGTPLMVDDLKKK